MVIIICFVLYEHGTLQARKIRVQGRDTFYNTKLVSQIKLSAE